MGNKNNCLKLGIEHTYGYNNKDIDHNLAKKYFMMSVKGGDIASHIWLASIYLNASLYTGIDDDYLACKELINNAIKLGIFEEKNAKNSEIQNCIGWMYENGIVLSQNNDLALEWYLRSADQENPNAYYNIGMFYVNVLDNYDEAIDWLKLAIDNGNRVVYKDLNNIYEWLCYDKIIKMSIENIKFIHSDIKFRNKEDCINRGHAPMNMKLIELIIEEYDVTKELNKVIKHADIIPLILSYFWEYTHYRNGYVDVHL